MGPCHARRARLSGQCHAPPRCRPSPSGVPIYDSGGSRCNVTNAIVSERDFWGGRRTIIRRILRTFSVDDTIKFFSAVGVPLHEEAHGKLFPDSNRSRDVLDALLREVAACGVVLQPSTRVIGLEPINDGWRLETPDTELGARTVVLATGGQSLPKSGSDGAGLEIARRLGHAIVPTTPALVPLVLAAAPDALHLELQGVASKRCNGLYFVGEILDVDGRLGGFNFQWAWSSARRAALALACLDSAAMHRARSGVSLSGA